MIKINTVYPVPNYGYAVFVRGKYSGLYKVYISADLNDFKNLSRLCFQPSFESFLKIVHARSFIDDLINDRVCL